VCSFDAWQSSTLKVFLPLPPLLLSAVYHIYSPSYFISVMWEVSEMTTLPLPHFAESENLIIMQSEEIEW